MTDAVPRGKLARIRYVLRHWREILTWANLRRGLWTALKRRAFAMLIGIPVGFVTMSLVHILAEAVVYDGWDVSGLATLGFLNSPDVVGQGNIVMGALKWAGIPFVLCYLLAILRSLGMGLLSYQIRMAPAGLLAVVREFRAWSREPRAGEAICLGLGGAILGGLIARSVVGGIAFHLIFGTLAVLLALSAARSLDDEERALPRPRQFWFVALAVGTGLLLTWTCFGYPGLLVLAVGAFLRWRRSGRPGAGGAATAALLLVVIAFLAGAAAAHDGGPGEFRAANPNGGLIAYLGSEGATLLILIGLLTGGLGTGGAVAGDLLGTATGELVRQFLAGAGAGGDPVRYDAGHAERLRRILDGIGFLDTWGLHDPALMARYDALVGRIRQNGQIDPAELAAFEATVNARTGRVEAANAADQRDWADRQLQERVNRLRQEAELEAQQRALRQRMSAYEAQMRNLRSRLPVSQWEMIDRMLERFSSVTSPNPDDLTRIQRATFALFSQVQAGHERAHAAATIDAARAQMGMDAARNIQRGAMVAGLVVGFVPAAPATLARLALINLARGGAEGAVAGYQEGGGFRGAMVGAARGTLPVNAGLALYRGEGAAAVGLGLVQDLGNGLGLRGAARGYRQLAGSSAASGAARTRAARQLAGESDEAAIAARAQARMRQATDAAGRARAPALTRADQQWRQDRAQARTLIQEHQDLQRQAAAAARAGDPARMADAERALRQNVARINENYQARLRLKNMDDAPTARQFQQTQQRYNDLVDRRHLERMNEAGLQRGGRPLQPSDMREFRNATSRGVGIDRDRGLAETPGVRPRLSRNGEPVSVSRFGRQAQDTYDQAYQDVYGQGASARRAMHTVTTSAHPEAYRDLNVLANNPRQTPFSREWGEQTAGVTRHKVNEVNNLVSHGQLSVGDGQQEIARGLAKDMRTKLLPLLQSDPNVDPAKLRRLTEMQDFLEQAGNGRYPPSQVDALCRQRFGTDVNGLAGQVDSNLASGIQFRPRTVWPGAGDRAGEVLRTVPRLVKSDGGDGQ